MPGSQDLKKRTGIVPSSALGRSIILMLHLHLLLSKSSNLQPQGLPSSWPDQHYLWQLCLPSWIYVTQLRQRGFPQSWQRTSPSVTRLTRASISPTVNDTSAILGVCTGVNHFDCFRLLCVWFRFSLFSDVPCVHHAQIGPWLRKTTESEKVQIKVLRRSLAELWLLRHVASHDSKKTFIKGTLWTELKF